MDFETAFEKERRSLQQSIIEMVQGIESLWLLELIQKTIGHLI